MVTKIEKIELYHIYDSLGGQTLEAVIDGHAAACAGGISRSAYEAPIVPVAQALRVFEKSKKELLGTFSQSSFDAKLSKLLPKIGAQATTALSLAFYSASYSNKPKANHNEQFPTLLGNVLGGGAHSPCKTRMKIQEILTIPRTKTLTAAIETNFKIWRAVGEELQKRGTCGLGFEAAWAADTTDETALEIVSKIAKQNRAVLGVDMAASQFYRKGQYTWSDKMLNRDAHIERVLGLAKRFKLGYIEDPVHEDDFEGFAKILERTKGRTFVCGDDLISTNLDRLKRAIRERAINAVIVKPNQNGTIGGSIAVIEHAKRNGITPVISHRSRETPDTSVCKLALQCTIAKFGVAGIRTVKSNGLLRLWRSSSKPQMAPLHL